jgi:hypothetical protein
MKIVTLAAFAAISLFVSGCATIVDGSKQSVSVATTPVQGARCTLKNTEGTWYITTPGSTTVHKTKNDMSVDCTKDGYADGHQMAVAHFGGATFGNIVLGGGVGAIVDAASGANYYYDSPITVPLGEPVSPSSGAESKPVVK